MLSRKTIKLKFYRILRVTDRRSPQRTESTHQQPFGGSNDNKKHFAAIKTACLVVVSCAVYIARFVGVGERVVSVCTFAPSTK